MSKQDGSGRLYSPPGADDTGANFLHVDMDAFFVAVETLDDPSLKGKPVVIAHRDGRSVVSSASYEARRYGVRSAMPLGMALQRCPHAVVVPPTFDRYRETSAQVMEVFRSITPLVEPLSIDEAFLDVRGVRRLWGSPGEVASLIRRRVKEEIGITCSVGGAATKHVAKMASTASKPNGRLIIPAARTQEFLDPRPAGSLWGVGPKAAEALAGRAIHTIRDIRETPVEVLARVLGATQAQRIHELANGLDARGIETERVEKSVSHEETFSNDVSDIAFLNAEVLRLADRVAVRLRRGGVEASGVAIKLRFADFQTITRSQALSEPTAVGQRIGQVARELLASVDMRAAVRLIGVRAERLVPAGSAALALWDDDGEWKQVEGALDVLSEKFGTGSVTRAAFLNSDQRRPPERPPEESD
ncbi:DNA polymerase IV [Microbacterium sorbitolivorans]|uniref:DNA polymerase IV n=1 Tax=Microbacterium sorbitolivorans TaxID=1867410 RepID=A0A367Y765_9MICO|nr:DNA polymerase IV [Microbacterium sorbitolivorans]RCK61460.1 DNA polymerase IV [Microbacterium sorbitolivorans]GGF31984.1 DNA polymerase IV [Microbacterium sorbitolivorans]